MQSKRANLKGTTSIVDTSTLASKRDLASLKTKINDLNVVKLKKVSVDLSKLSNVVENNVVKNTVYNQLATKLSATEVENTKH